MKIKTAHKNLVLIFITITGIVFFYSSCKKSNPDYPGGPCPACPVIESISPTTLSKGDTVKIKGKNFSTDIFNDSVIMNGKTAEICFTCGNSENTLYAIVPSRVGSGELQIFVDEDLESNKLSFTYVPIYTMTTLTNGTFERPFGLTLDAMGNLYVVDGTKDQIFLVDTSSGNISVFAGSGIDGYDDASGSLSNCKFKFLSDIKFGPANKLYVADFDIFVLREINLQSNTISSIGIYPNTPSDSSSLFSTPEIRFDQINNMQISGDKLYYSQIGSTGNSAYKIKYFSPLSTLGQTHSITLGGKGTLDGQTDIAQVNYPAGLAIGANDEIYFCDDNKIRKIYNNEVTTIAGSTNPGFHDGIGTNALFHEPTDIEFGPDGNLYISDYWNNCIRQLNPVTLEVKQIAGSKVQSPGPADSLLNHPWALCFGNGVLFVTDKDNKCIKKITLD